MPFKRIIIVNQLVNISQHKRQQIQRWMQCLKTTEMDYGLHSKASLFGCKRIRPYSSTLWKHRSHPTSQARLMSGKCSVEKVKMEIGRLSAYVEVKEEKKQSRKDWRKIGGRRDRMKETDGEQGREIERDRARERQGQKVVKDAQKLVKIVLIYPRL